MVNGEVLYGYEPALFRLNVSDSLAAAKSRVLTALELFEASQVLLSCCSSCVLVCVSAAVVGPGRGLLLFLGLGKPLILGGVGSIMGRLVVVQDNGVTLSGKVKRWVLAVEERSERDVPWSHTRIVLDNYPVKVGNEEGIRDDQHTKEGTQNDTDSSASSKLF
jgi:hypothetical protein